MGKFAHGARLGLVGCLALGLGSAVWGQTFSKEDSGWVPLFNGKDFQGLYSRLYNQPVMNTVESMFKVGNAGTDSVEITIGNVNGEIGTQRTSYSHYRMRVQYRFDRAAKINAGFLYAIDETYPRMGGDGTTAKGNWPRSIECQMMQGDAGDAFSIQQVTFDTRINNNNMWDPNGRAIKVCEHGCDGRSFNATPDNADKPGPNWNDMEVVVRGADSALHNVNGRTVFRLWNIRITDNKGVTQNPWPSGAVGLEAEGAPIHYRRWEIMELPATGPNFLNRLFVTSPNTGAQLTAGSTANVTWKTLGDVKKVSVFYNLGAGAGWVKAADNINNTGSYAWPVPSDATAKLRVKVTAPDTWVMADSSDGDNAIITSSAIHAIRTGRNGASVAGDATASGARDPLGRSIRSTLLKALKSIGFMAR
jgi:hypothetical protein